MTKSDVSSADEGYFMKKIYKKKSAKKNNFKCDFAETKIKGFSSNFLVGLSLTYCCMQNFNQKIIMVIKLLSMVKSSKIHSKKLRIQSTFGDSQCGKTKNSLFFGNSEALTFVFGKIQPLELPKIIKI